MRSRLFAVAVLLSVISNPAFSASNLVPNGDFSNGLSGWAPGTGTAPVLVTTDGFSSAPSVELAGGMLGSSDLRSDCLALDSSLSYDISLYYKGRSGGGTSVVLLPSGSSDCSFSTSEITVLGGFPSPVTEWTLASITNQTFAAGFTHFKIAIKAQSAGDDLFVDNFVVTAHQVTPVRLQSFGVD